MYNRLLIAIFSYFSFASLLAQDCSITIRGLVDDPDTGEALEVVNVFFQEIDRGAITDHDGEYEISGICPGSYHLIFSHIGCESKQVFLKLTKDTIVNMRMDHSASVLHNVVVTGSKAKETTQTIETISSLSIQDNSDDNLSDLLESIPGVSTIRNGSGISKPVVHGLYGNRLTILNNGVAQSGQQWGNDHSPEIDPLVANKIRVIKGTSSLTVMGSNLGSVILVEPNKIEREPHLHGKASYFYETNGRGHGINAQAQQFVGKVGWKLNGTFKRSGDRHSPDYYLTNTGNLEANLALQLEYPVNDKWTNELYLSSFNSELGILRGSHVGNLTDLESAFQRDEPFFTRDTFMYTITAPRQAVNHHLLKLNSKYYFDDSQSIDITLATQVNNRKEFDVRRSGRSDIPALNLLQFSFFGEGKYKKRYENRVELQTGAQLNIVDNTNNPETGILPLIPDYRSFESGAFVILNKRTENSFLEFGIRYDNTIQNVVRFTQDSLIQIIRNNNLYSNLSSSLGWTYTLTDAFSIATNLGYAMRNPAINELYSQGLHQGVSGIEEGNISLKTEKGLKATLGLKGKVGDHFSFESLAYFQNINDYIFLDPQEEIRLTIRGAFPVFIYDQSDARIYGLDLTTSYEFNSSLAINGSFSFIKGQDLDNDLSLLFLPSNNLDASISYEFPNSIKIGSKELQNLKMQLSNRYVFMQNDITDGQDFVLPPDAYNLLSFDLSTNIQLGHNRLRFVAKVDNLLNVKYRDYLNRQRYFADDLGRSITLGLGVKF